MTKPYDIAQEAANLYNQINYGLEGFVSWLCEKEATPAIQQALTTAFEAGRREAGQWLPIETAPRDGQKVLLWWPYWNGIYPVVGWFGRPRHSEHYQWLSDVCLSDDGPQPTRYQPLPQPPEKPE
jgi:hypothetical protein